MSIEAARARLLAALPPKGVTDADVLRAMARVPRDRFLPAGLRARAYDDCALPIGHGQTISQPAVVGYMTQTLELDDGMQVLEIGTGSGYQAAVLAKLCRRVCTIERCRPLLRAAKARFAALGLDNIAARWGDGREGWPEEAPFDRILVTAAAGSLPAALPGQLAPDGILLLPLGGSVPGQDLVKCRERNGSMTRETLWPVRFVPLLAGLARAEDD